MSGLCAVKIKCLPTGCCICKPWANLIVVSIGVDVQRNTDGVPPPSLNRNTSLSIGSIVLIKVNRHLPRINVPAEKHSARKTRILLIEVLLEKEK